MTGVAVAADPPATRRAHRPLLVVLGCALALRVVILWQCEDLAPRILDEQHYLALASSLYDGAGFAFPGAGPTSLRPPLYPFLVSLQWKLLGEQSLQAVRATQCVLGVLTAWLVFLLGARVFGQRAGLWAASLYAFYPTIVGFNFLLLTETLFNLLVVAGALAYARLVDTRGIGWALALGALVALAALTRSVAWPFFLLLGIALPLLVGARLPRGVAITLAAFVGFAVVVGPWSHRNTQLQGTSTLIDTMGGLNLYMGNFENTPLTRAWDAISLRGTQSWAYRLYLEKPPEERWTEGRKEKWAKAKALEFILDNPGLTLLRSTIKFANFWGMERVLPAGWQRGWYKPPRVLQALGTVAVTASWVLVSIAGVLGLFLARGRSPRIEAYFWLLAFVMAGVHSLVFGHARYHMPLIPFLCIYAAVAAEQRVWTAIRPLGPASGAALACIVGLVGIWAWEILFVEGDKIRSLVERIL